KLAAAPSLNLVENVGWGVDATHGVAAGKRDHRAVPMPFPLRHPATVELNPEVERELELVLSRLASRAAILARRLVRSPQVRRAARTVVNSRAARDAQRFVSQLREKGHRA